MQQQIAVKGRSAVRRSALVPRSAGHHRRAHLCNKAPQTTVHFNVDQNASRAAELLYKQHNVRCHQPGTPTGPLAETCKAIRLCTACCSPALTSPGRVHLLPSQRPANTYFQNALADATGTRGYLFGKSTDSAPRVSHNQCLERFGKGS